MIAIVDYNVGNLSSVQKALAHVGHDSVITGRAEDLKSADAVILPGVGAFPDAMAKLVESGLDGVIKEEAKKKPLLGICLGMQLLFESSDEFVFTRGLSLIEGRVEKIPGIAGVKIPHMGWNRLVANTPCPLLKGLEEGAYAYFVHSYHASAKKPENLAAYADYGIRISAVVQNGLVFGTQFHPEKSGDYGLKILKNFGELVNDYSSGN